MFNRLTLLIIVRVLLLLLVLAVERVGGLPVWFLFGTLSLAHPYDWQTRMGILLVLGVGLSLSYVLPFAVGFIVVWGGVWLMDTLEPMIKSQTVRFTGITLLGVVIISLLKGYSWSWTNVGLHVLSLAIVVGLYRLYVTYQVLAPRRLQLSRRLRNQI